jgi:HK97 family phage prohead protease
MPDLVHVTFGGLELRVPSMSERIVEGIVVPWGETSYFTPDPKGERFKPGSLTRTVNERGPRIKLYRAHDHGHAVGKPVSWDVDHAAGCWAQFRIAATTAGDDVLNEIREGMLDAFSVGFVPKRQARGADGAREVIEASLHEVSICPMGAYDGARVLAMRSTGPTGPSQSILPPMPAVNLAPLVLPSRWTT